MTCKPGEHKWGTIRWLDTHAVSAWVMFCGRCGHKAVSRNKERLEERKREGR